MNRVKTSIIPIPMNLGQPSIGLDKGPEKLLSGGLKTLLGDLGWRIKISDPLIFTNTKPDPTNYSSINAKNCPEVGKGCEYIYNSVKQEIENDSFPLILGGDHCISIGTVPAIKTFDPNAAVVWVDAHADINTPETSPTGNMHGMPVAFLLGLINHPSLPGFKWFKPCLKPSDIVYIGLRDVDAGEKAIIRKLGIKAFSMTDIDRLGIGNVMDECLSYLGDRSIHLSFDIDAIDPFYAPHTGTAVTGGLTFREGNYVCEALYESGRLSSMEIVEVDPTQQPGESHDKTTSVALTLVSGAMGRQII